ncbi:MAG: 2-C-methyl-D-erythritol 4-phosphate cytidylyltransferase [Actinomycetota bacterium]|nr:2-C-methyl-D-erythritol 4-phosphate cytidylyltransferase [Actinomycetota bacterium]
MSEVTAVVVAAGRGQRLADAGAGRPKALVEIDGRPLLDLALTTLRAVPAITAVVVVHPPGAGSDFRAVAGSDVALVAGGPSRSASVRCGVKALVPGSELVAIHDAARPLVPPAVIADAVEAVTGDVVAAAPGLPVTDTLKRVGTGGDVVATVGRGGLWAVHTPQVIRRDVLERTLDWAHGRDATDDLSLVEEAIAAGAVVGRVRLVRGDPRGLKVTHPEDLLLAAAIVRGTRP